MFYHLRCWDDVDLGTIGGLARNRTGVQGFAVLCVTTPPRGPTNVASPIAIDAPKSNGLGSILSGLQA